MPLSRPNYCANPTAILVFCWLLISHTAHAQKDSGWTVRDASQSIDTTQQLVNEPTNKAQLTTEELSVEEKSLTEQEPLAEQELSIKEESSVDEEPLVDSQPSANKKLSTINNPQLAKDLEQQYQALSQALETEDAFSPRVGELYYEHGSLLKQLGRYDDARKAMANAQHVTKINNGIYSIEQRPALKGLFEIDLAQGDSEAFEESLNRILWLERKNDQLDDDFAFELLVQAGNHYLDSYLARPISSETTVQILALANRHFNHAINRYGDAPLSDLLMPYGELALTNLLQSKVYQNYNGSALSSRSYQDSAFRAGSYGTERGGFQSQTLTTGSLISAESALNRYLIKAKDESNTEQITIALLNLGDMNLLTGRSDQAQLYYQRAWEEAQNLTEDNQVRVALNKPVKLPAFNYSGDRGDVQRARPTIKVPLTFRVREDGKAIAIMPILPEDENAKYYSRAKRALNKLLFRPAIIDGKLAAVDEFTYAVKVKSSKKKTS